MSAPRWSITLWKVTRDVISVLYRYAGVAVIPLLPTVLFGLNMPLRLSLLHTAAILLLPFAVVPASRWLTKLTIHSTGFYQAEAKPMHFLEALRADMVPVALIRGANIAAFTIVFYRVFSAWSFNIQEAVLYLNPSGPLPVELVAMHMLLLILALLVVLLISVVTLLIALWMFRYATRPRRRDRREPRPGGERWEPLPGNAAVAIVYASLLIADFLVAGESAPRIVGVFLRWIL